MKKTNFIILCLLWGISLFSLYPQYPGDVVELTAAPGVSEVKACQSIVLKPGFSFTASSGKSLSLKADPSVCSPYVQENLSLSSSQNYIVTITPLDETDKVEINNGQVTMARGTRTLTSIQYFDGLGRPMQTVQKGVTPGKQDLVAIQEYDGFGRESNVWLPTPMGSNGAFTSLPEVQAAAQGYYADAHPYTKPVYEASPLNRVLAQFGPGEAWHSKGKAVHTNFLTNNTGIDTLNCVYYFVNNNNDLQKKGNYESCQLYVTRVSNEDGNRVYEFKDKQGQVVLTRQMDGNTRHDTYYVYDNFGNLRFVLPPIASDRLTQDKAYSLADNVLRDYAYVYRYDHRNRNVMKRLPGCDSISMIYDKADRLRIIQDGEQRKEALWVFIKYNVFGQEVMRGTIHRPNTSLADMQAAIDHQATIYESFDKNESEGYSWNSYPQALHLSSVKILSVNYYDHYSFLERNGSWASLGYQFKEGFDRQYINQNCSACSAKGLLTGTRMIHLDDSGETVVAMYYDDKGRVIQQKSTNHLGGVDKTYYSYTFTGLPTKMLVEHSSSASTITELYTYNYDHAGRLTETRHQLNNQPEVVLASNEYDELGRLKQIQNAEQSKLKTQYSYNIRSWTKRIKSPLFEQELFYEGRYNSDMIGTNTPSYSGNISGIYWDGAETTTQNNNSLFKYDGLSRLTEAKHGGVNPMMEIEYIHETFSYDKHGNFEGLQRHHQGIYQDGYADNLLFRYTGNQLKKVDEFGSRTEGFVKYSDQETEYAFDANGSMIRDLNKGISSIEYNYLNLPEQMAIKSPVAEAKNSYLYSADGRKLRVVQRWNSNYSTTPVIGSTVNESSLDREKRTDYVGNKIYENGSLKLLQVEGGYYDFKDSKYYFYLKDHLGNNRVTADSRGTVAQSVHYLAFGNADPTNSLGEEKQPFLYNGKELDVMHGLEMYDYGARLYDLGVRRWGTVDPLAEKYYSVSPYVYCLDNPTKFVDPDGRDPEQHFKSIKAAAVDFGKYYNGPSIKRNKEFASTIYYAYDKEGKLYFSYTVANMGDRDSVTPSKPSNGKKGIANAHTHGAWNEDYVGYEYDSNGNIVESDGNNKYNNNDKQYDYKTKTDGYLASPNGTLQKYDVEKAKVTTISTEMPSDSKDPGHKNEIKAVDNPNLKYIEIKKEEK